MDKSSMDKTAKKILVIGASRGIGAEIVKHFSCSGYQTIGVSRTPAHQCDWIQADISTSAGIETIAKKIGQTPIDALIFSSAIWENDGFSDKFDFRKTHEKETREILSVNLVAPIEISKKLANNLSLSSNPRAIYLGSLSGTEAWASDQVAYSASKFGLRGAIQALRQALIKENIGFTVINPGNVATEEVLRDIHEGRTQAQVLIPIADIISTIEWLLSLSISVEVGDINLIQRKNQHQLSE